MNVTGYGETAAAGLPPSPTKKKTLGQLGRQATGLNWKPGQSIKKFDFNDLPSVASLADEIFKEDFNIPMNLRNVFGEPKAGAGKKKGGTTGVGLSHRSGPPPGGETFGNATYLKEELMKVSAQIKGDLHANIGFGFTSVNP